MKKQTEMTEREYKAFIRKVSTRFAKMSAKAQSQGYAAPEEGDLSELTQAVMAALDIAIRTRDWAYVGYGMLLATHMLDQLEEPIDATSMTALEHHFIDHLFTWLTRPRPGEQGH